MGRKQNKGRKNVEEKEGGNFKQGGQSRPVRGTSEQCSREGVSNADKGTIKVRIQ